jgi:regulator of sigma E protease
MIGAPGDVNTTVKRVESGTPAQAMGLRPGDTIVAVNARQTPNFDAVSQAIRGSNGKPTTVTVLRGQTAKMLGPIRTQKIGDRFALGFEPAWDTTQYGPGGAMLRSLEDNWHATRATATFLPRIVTNSGRKQVSGPTGIVDVSQQVIAVSFTWYLLVLGLVSLSLALLNLLPLLPLDGGHILFSIVEGVRGRAVGREVYVRVSAIGIALFLVLMFIGLSNDINRLGGG